MATARAIDTIVERETVGNLKRISGALGRAARRGIVREFLIFLIFCAFTAALTWPYVTRLRDVVVDPGDPYLIAWILWWDYHATFTNPLHLFDANLFYPLRYTLAFSENSYGISLLFFPLFAMGFRPLTVHAVAMFVGFALCGYGAFRLGRTLTGSAGVGWVAGIIFAFIPYRFSMMSQLAYLFSPWIPLVFEALVLFVRERSRKRAAWLGCAFFMSGLTTITWFNLSLLPLALTGAILLTRYSLWRDREFWRRSIVALGLAGLALLPFMLPYYIASKLYGFKRDINEVQYWSAWPSHWLAGERRNKLWHHLGDNVNDGGRHRLFPGLIPILLSLTAVVFTGRPKTFAASVELGQSRQRWVRRLDALAVLALALLILAHGYEGTNALWGLFNFVTGDRLLGLLTATIIARLCLAYPSFMRTEGGNFIETLRLQRRSDAFWIGMLLTGVGFCYSLGWNFFFYRLCYDLIPTFKSMRVVSRSAIFAYLGLALLSGLGAQRLVEVLRSRMPRLRPGAIYSVACVLLLLELNAAPLKLERGDVFPDGVTLWLKKTPMKGGVVVLPAGPTVNHRHVLRSADHQKPLIVGISGFGSPYETEIEVMTQSGNIPLRLVTFLESVPASYLVIENQIIPPERKPDYERFLKNALTSGRLRLINRFDGRDDLYAFVKTEPEARSEAALSIDLSIRDWAAMLADDPVNLLGQPVDWSQQLYRIDMASSGAMPRYKEYLSDLEIIGRGVVLGSEKQNEQFEDNLRRFLEDWTNREAFKKAFGGLDNEQYLDRLVNNAGISIDPTQRVAMVTGLSNTQETRSTVLLKIVQDPRFVEKEKYRSLLLLHYFGYLRRNPDDPPDRDLSGFNFWLRHGDPERLSLAFRNSPEYQDVKRPGAPFAPK